MKDAITAFLKARDAFWENDPTLPPLFDKDLLDQELTRLAAASSITHSQITAKILQVKDIYENLPLVRKESETCSKIIEPLLEMLGFKKHTGILFDEQREFVVDEKRYIPDYCLFETSQEQISANEKSGTDYYQRTRLIVEAKRVGLSLLTRNSLRSDLDDRGSDSIQSISPSSQIRTYLRLANVNLGILTNGNDWVLYSRNKKGGFSTYHIRLQELIGMSEALEKPELLTYWLIPFSRAFLLEQQSRSVNSIIERTDELANSLEENLKERLTPIILDILNEAYGESRKKRQFQFKKEQHVTSIISLIYALFYVACLEDRNLLPMSCPLYGFQYSLQRLFSLVTDPKTAFKPTVRSYHVFRHLRSLLSLVANGCDGLGDDQAIGKMVLAKTQMQIPPVLRLPDSFFAPLLARLLRSPSSDQMAYFGALDTVQFGNIYEHILRLDITFNKTKDMFISKTMDGRDDEKATAVFTPAHIVSRMVSSVVEAYPIESWKDVERIRFIDPCFGSGHFLIEFARQMSIKITDCLPREKWAIPQTERETPHEQKIKLQRYLFLTSIFGVDRAPSCTLITKYAIWLSTAYRGYSPIFLELQLTSGNSLYGKTDINNSELSKADRNTLERLAFERTQARKTLVRQTRISDRATRAKLERISRIEQCFSPYFRRYFSGTDLVDVENRDEIAAQQTPLSWVTKFPEVFLRGGFNVYVTNPPYDQLKSSPTTQKYQANEHAGFRLSKITDLDIRFLQILCESDPVYKDYQDGFKNLYEEFILLKDKLLIQGGIFSLIVPNSILGGEQTTRIRKNLWRDELSSIDEFPEKDSTRKRVFKSRKVACAILSGQKKGRFHNDRESLPVFKGNILYRMFPDANNLGAAQEGIVTYDGSSEIDAEQVPFVVLSKSQRTILGKLEGMRVIKLNKKQLFEGELNESLSKAAIEDSFRKGLSKIYGTNRITTYCFNFWTKQDSIQYCDLKEAKISKSKTEDIAHQRVAINGIAGVNDSRVLCSVVIPSGVLLNSNVNYVANETLRNFYDHYAYCALLNCPIYDDLIRIQKRTNHNSSGMIAALPIIDFDRLGGVPDLEEILAQDVTKWENITLKVGEKQVLTTKAYLWLSEMGKLATEVQIALNSLIYDALAELNGVIELNTEQEHVLCRKFAHASFDLSEFSKEKKLLPKVVMALKRKLSGITVAIAIVVELSNNLSALNFEMISTVLALDKFTRDEIVSRYGLQKKFRFVSLAQVSSELEKIKFEVHEEYSDWGKAA